MIFTFFDYRLNKQTKQQQQQSNENNLKFHFFFLHQICLVKKKMVKIFSRMSVTNLMWTQKKRMFQKKSSSSSMGGLPLKKKYSEKKSTERRKNFNLKKKFHRPWSFIYRFVSLGYFICFHSGRWPEIRFVFFHFRHHFFSFSFLAVFVFGRFFSICTNEKWNKMHAKFFFFFTENAPNICGIDWDDYVWKI